MRSAVFTFAICLGRAAAHGPSEVPLNGMIEGDSRASGMNLVLIPRQSIFEHPS
jgi:hypothetical protein